MSIGNESARQLVDEFRSRGKFGRQEFLGIVAVGDEKCQERLEFDAQFRK